MGASRASVRVRASAERARSDLEVMISLYIGSAV